MDAWVEGLPKGSEDFPNLYEEMREVLAAKEEPHQQVVPQFGKFCGGSKRLFVLLATLSGETLSSESDEFLEK